MESGQNNNQNNELSGQDDRIKNYRINGSIIYGIMHNLSDILLSETDLSLDVCSIISTYQCIVFTSSYFEMVKQDLGCMKPFLSIEEKKEWPTLHDRYVRKLINDMEQNYTSVFNIRFPRSKLYLTNPDDKESNVNDKQSNVIDETKYGHFIIHGGVKIY